MNKKIDFHFYEFEKSFTLFFFYFKNFIFLLNEAKMFLWKNFRKNNNKYKNTQDVFFLI